MTIEEKLTYFGDVSRETAKELSQKELADFRNGLEKVFRICRLSSKQIQTSMVAIFWYAVQDSSSVVSYSELLS